MPIKNKEERAKYNKEWRARNKEKILKYNRTIRQHKRKELRLQFKKKVVDMLGGKCCKCGYNKNLKALEFHHTDGAKKENMISRLVHNYSLEKLMIEAEKCILVCSNCHREIHNPDSIHAPIV